MKICHRFLVGAVSFIKKNQMYSLLRSFFVGAFKKKIKNPLLIFLIKCESYHIRPVNKPAKLTLPPNTPRIKAYLSLCLQHPAKTMDISSMPCCAFVWTVYIFAWGQKQDDGYHIHVKTFRKYWKSESFTTWVLYA